MALTGHNGRRRDERETLNRIDLMDIILLFSIAYIFFSCLTGVVRSGSFTHEFRRFRAQESLLFDSPNNFSFGWVQTVAGNPSESH
jgi:hypothetical protein